MIRHSLFLVGMFLAVAIVGCSGNQKEGEGPASPDSGPDTPTVEPSVDPAEPAVPTVDPAVDEPAVDPPAPPADPADPPSVDPVEPLPLTPPVVAPATPDPGDEPQDDLGAYPTIDVPGLLAKFDGADSKTRCALLDELAKARRGASSALPKLIELLGGDDAEVSWHAARTIGAIGPGAADALPALMKSATHENATVRAYSCYALGCIGPASEAAAGTLVECAVDDDQTVRRAAHRALVRVQAPREKTIPLMVKALGTANPAIVNAAVHNMAELGAKVVPAMRDALKGEGMAPFYAAMVLSEVGADALAAVPELLDASKHELPEIRLQTVVALGEVGDKAAVGRLIEILESDDSPGVRYAAAYSLGQIADASAKDVLARSVESEDFFLKLIGAWALAKIDSENEEVLKKTAQIIAQGLKSENAGVRQAAARALAETNVPSEITTPALIAVLPTMDGATIAQAIHAMAALGAEAVPRVINGLRNKDLRIYAAEVVKRIGPPAKDAAPVLIETLQDADDPVYRAKAQMALGAIGPDSAAATPLLITSLQDPVPDVRYSACFALGKIGPAAASAADSLKALLETDDEFFRLTALWALIRVQPNNEEVRGLATPLLVKALSHERETVRAEAATALGDIGASAASDRLRAMGNDPSQMVRKAAAAALQKLTAGA